MNPDSYDGVAHLTEELERLRRELTQLQQATCHSGPRGLLRAGRLMTAVPLLLVGTWVLSAGAPATQEDLEQRVSDLEARLIKGPGSTTRIQAPFEVVGPGGNVILQVSQSLPTVSNGVGIFWQGKNAAVTVSKGGHDVAGMGTNPEGPGGALFIGDQNGVPRAEVLAADGVNVLDAGGKVVASMEATDENPSGGRFAIMQGETMIASLEAGDEGGTLDISNEKGKSVAQLGVDGGNGYIATLDPKGYAEVEMGVTDKGEPSLEVREKGKIRAALRLSAGAGHLSLSNPKNQVVANVTATGPANGGAVIVANGSGQGIANVTAGADGSGLVQVFQPGGKPLAVLTGDQDGGFLQLRNQSGIPVASFKAGDGGGGYWQLTDPAGNPVVEGGQSDGRGIVRTGPYYKCEPGVGTAIVGVAALPNCIRGRTKP